MAVFLLKTDVKKTFRFCKQTKRYLALFFCKLTVLWSNLLENNEIGVYFKHIYEIMASCGKAVLNPDFYYQSTKVTSRLNINMISNFSEELTLSAM